LIGTIENVPLHEGWLSAGERERLSSLRIAKRRDDWRLGRWTAKRAVRLAGAHGGFDAAEIEIRSAEDGAPEVLMNGERAALALSLSHRNGRALCVIGPPDVALGCDLELVEERDPVFVLDYFTDEEQLVVAEAPEGDRAALITAIWSAKESALKAIRTGLRSGTRDVFVRPGAVGLSSEWTGLTVEHPTTERTFHCWWRAEVPWVTTVVADRPMGPPVPLVER
jgi:4'-phosphopantetheinyl transferase